MFAAPPIANLLVIRSNDIEKAMSFYLQMGLAFSKHAHGKGPEHYSSSVNGFVFEIYPRRENDDSTENVRIGFSVDSVDQVVEMLKELDATVVSEPKDSEWGRRAVVKDFDGHTIELLTPLNRDQ